MGETDKKANENNIAQGGDNGGARAKIAIITKSQTTEYSKDDESGMTD